jgi:hypothetical protein
MARMKSRTRTYLRRAERVGLATEEETDIAFADEYHHQLVDVFASSGLTPTYGVERVRKLIEIVGPSGQLSMMRLLGPDGDRLGTILTIGRNSRAALWGLAWYRSAAELHPVEPIQWAAMQYWHGRGMSIYDMDGNHPAKAKFGGQVRLEYRMHHSKYAVLEHGRNAVRSLFYSRQRLMGRVQERTRARSSRDGSDTRGDSAS